MKKKKLKLNNKHIIDLMRNKKNFFNFAKEIEKTFNGPSAYFYLKTIEMVRNSNYKELFEDNNYFEYLYATLTAWGMHRMDKYTRMAEFEIFKESIVKNKDLIIELSKEKLKCVNISTKKEKLLQIFRNLRIMARANSPKLVAHSKIMHFLLPDLIPPIDKGHIVFFFYGSWKKNNKEKFVKHIPQISNEEMIFISIFQQFQVIAKKMNLKEQDLKGKWNTSIPKLIDNAIIGYNIYHKKKIFQKK